MFMNLFEINDKELCFLAFPTLGIDTTILKINLKTNFKTEKN